MSQPIILRVYKGEQLIEVKQFTQDNVVIGKSDVELNLNDDSISPIHCMIEKRGNKFYLCDLGSQTGTKKNNRTVLDEEILTNDEIEIGIFRIVFFNGVPKSAGEVKIAPIFAMPTEKPAAVKPVVEKTEPAQEKPKLKVTKPSVEPSKTKSKHGTYAPPSAIKDLRDELKPGKGPVVEVILAWQERVLTTMHIPPQGLLTGAMIAEALPDFPVEIPAKYVLLDMGPAGVNVQVAANMDFELIRGQVRKNLDSCVQSGKAKTGGVGCIVRLEQEEIIRVSPPGKKLDLYIRFSPTAPRAALVPPFLLSGTETTGVILSMLIVGLLAFYISATTPKLLQENPNEDLTRIAQVIFQKPPPPKTPPEPPQPPPKEVPPPPPPPPKKPQQAKVADIKKEIQKKAKEIEKPASKASTQGQASEVAPKPDSKNKPKKFTSIKQGGGIKLGKEAGANANLGKDPNKVGLFSAFGGNGMRSKLDQASAGAGEVIGDANKATGSQGFAQNRPGDDLGSRFKDTGAGGKGTAIQGIAGIGTKGRGSGQSAYGAVDGLGAKSSVAIESGGAEEDFIGTIDKEAVRRAVKHNISELRGCYERQLNRLEKGQRLEGKVVVSWTIVEKGTANNVRIKSSTLNSPEVEKCIRQRLANWIFPEPPAGLTADVSYPFSFSQ